MDGRMKGCLSEEGKGLAIGCLARCTASECEGDLHMLGDARLKLPMLAN